MAIFPIVDTSVIVDDIIRDRGINFLFDFDIGDFIIKDGKFIELTEDAAVVFWIEKTLRTEYEYSAVYKNTEYGTILDSQRGKVMPQAVAKSIFETNIKNSLLKHERIKSIDNFNLEQIESMVHISFEVQLNPLTDVETFYAGSEEGFIKLTTLDEIKDFIGIKLLTSEKFYFKTNLGYQVYLD